jgi:uncharacterized protein YlxP (DUF503 family)
MLIVNCMIHLELPDVESLKGRRQVVNRVKDHLKRFNVSVMDVSDEYPKGADIAFVFLAPGSAMAARVRASVEHSLEQQLPEYTFEIDYEEI